MIINLAIPIKLGNQKSFDQYRIELVPVPVNISCIDNAPQSYTKLKLDHVSYIAVDENNFVELNNVTMEFCDNLRGYYICDDTILQTYRNQMTCAMAIFLAHGLENYSNSLHFDFYRNLEVPFSLTCKDKSVPLRLSGHPYCAIERSSLCNCATTTNSHYIAAKITGCDDEVTQMVLKYSVNAAMSVFFKTGKSKSTESIDVKKLYEDIPQMIIPQIDIIVNNEDSKDVFDGTDLSKPIDLNKLHNIVEHYGEIYLTNDDKLKRDLQCDHWFESNFAFGVSFILSLIGTIGM